VRHWFGWMMLAAGLPCWIMGLSMDLQVAGMLAKINASQAMPESMQHTAEWVKSTYWLAPYLLWIGGSTGGGGQRARHHRIADCRQR